MKKSRDDLIEQLQVDIRRYDREQLVRRWALEQLLWVDEKRQQLSLYERLLRRSKRRLKKLLVPLALWIINW